MELINFPSRILGAILIVLLLLVSIICIVVFVASRRDGSGPDIHVTDSGDIDKTRSKVSGHDTNKETP